MNSEKYELRPRDFARALAHGCSLEPFLGPAQRRSAACTPRSASCAPSASTPVDNDALLAYSKFDPVTGDTVLTVVTLNSVLPRAGHRVAGHGGRWLMQDYDRFWVRDEVTGEEYQWGQSNYVRLEPARAVAHILTMPTIPPDQRAALLRRE